MKRRDFVLGLGAAAVMARPAWAAGAPVEGKDYTRLSESIPVAVPGKIEVIEFFGYWCPHCAAFEPTLEAWARKLPSDVNFRHVPVAWQKAQEPYQRLYFALEALELLDTLHGKAFQVVQAQRIRLDSDANIASFAAALGTDGTKLVAAMNGFSVNARARIASQAVSKYGIDGVPTLAVDGHYKTSPAMAAGEAQALQVVDALIRKSRT